MGNNKTVCIVLVGRPERKKHLEDINKARKITLFGPKRDEVTGGRRKLHNEELHNFYSFPSIIRKIGRAHV
jgi:hypothetical protein